MKWRNNSSRATNLVNPLTCKGLPVPQQHVIKLFNYTPCISEFSQARLPTGVEHVLMVLVNSYEMA